VREVLNLLDQIGCERKRVQRHTFNVYHWHKALISAGITPSREDGMHALRHFFASVLLDAGESIKAIAEWLGHSDPAFTLRTYTHLMQSSQGRARRAVDALFGGPAASDGPQTARRED
jgi:integrase